MGEEDVEERLEEVPEEVTEEAKSYPMIPAAPAPQWFRTPRQVSFLFLSCLHSRQGPGPPLHCLRGWGSYCTS